MRLSVLLARAGRAQTSAWSDPWCAARTRGRAGHRGRRCHRGRGGPFGSGGTAGWVAQLNRGSAVQSAEFPTATMLFPTIDFAIFFAIAFTVNWLLNPYAVPWKLAMIGLSYFFYGWVGWSYCLLLLATTAVAHFGGVAIIAPRGPSEADVRPWVSRFPRLLGLLGWFKYYGFVSVNLDNLTHAIGLGRQMPLLQVTLPIAISFFTFMAVSYVVDIYRGAWSRPVRSTWPSTSPSSLTCWPDRSCGATSSCPRLRSDATPTRSTTRGPCG